MTIQEELKAKHDKIMATMLRVTESDQPLEQRKQLCAGFLHLVAQAAAGNLKARDEYIDTVIPGVKQAGIGLGVTIAGMVQVSVALVSEISPENMMWVAGFCSEHALLLGQAWEKA